MQKALENSVVSLNQLAQTPSEAAGFSAQQEQKLRFIICNFIDSSAIILNLPQNASTTAQVLVHRYFYMQSLDSLPLFVRLLLTVECGLCSFVSIVQIRRRTEKTE